MRNIEPISQREKGLRNDAAVAPLVPRYDLEQMAIPTLIVSAEDDLFGTFKGGRYTAEHIHGSLRWLSDRRASAGRPRKRRTRRVG